MMDDGGVVKIGGATSERVEEGVRKVKVESEASGKGLLMIG